MLEIKIQNKCLFNYKTIKVFDFIVKLLIIVIYLLLTEIIYSLDVFLFCVCYYQLISIVVMLQWFISNFETHKMEFAVNRIRTHVLQPLVHIILKLWGKPPCLRIPFLWLHHPYCIKERGLVNTEISVSVVVENELFLSLSHIKPTLYHILSSEGFG